MKYYTDIGNNEAMSFAAMWMSSEDIIISGIGQAQKGTCHLISCLEEKVAVV